MCRYALIGFTDSYNKINRFSCFLRRIGHSFNTIGELRVPKWRLMLKLFQKTVVRLPGRVSRELGRSHLLKKKLRS